MELLPTFASSPQLWSRMGEGLALLVALELALPLLARRGVTMRWVWHLWALVLAAALASRGLPGSGLAFAVRLLVAGLSGLVAFGLVDALVLARPWDRLRGPMLPRLARDVLRLLVVVACVLIATAGAGNDSLKAVLVSSTVVSAVLGLALQDVLKNVFAGLALDLEKPFQRGDWLLLDGHTPVEVIDVTWRSTWLRTREGVDLFEPNSTVNASRLVKYGRGNRAVGFSFEVALPFEVPPATAREILLAAAHHSPLVVTEPEAEAFLDRFGDFAAVYRLRVWTRAIAGLARFRDEVHSRVWYEVARRGIALPVPIRTVQLHQAEAEDASRDERILATAEGLLAGISLFAGLPEELRHRLAGSARREPWDTGEELVREGEHGDSLFVVAEGRLQVLRRAADGDQVPVGELARGDFFGESSLLTGAPRSATVRALVPTEVLVLSRQALAPLIEANPTVAEALSRALAERRAKTAASLEADARAETRTLDEEESLIDRVRAFFRLGSG